ncbi:helix-turn-helix domain-containing protein [Spirosoma soli]|uniref:Helix-turn-helix domain-containing protein n=1 Tax=Spirosoma soli TaxID=1770529 RepID=A0ABW5LYE4_9BACT
MKPIFLLYAELPLWLEQCGIIAMLIAPVLLFLHLKALLENKKRLVLFDFLHLGGGLFYIFLSFPDFSFNSHLYPFVLAQNLVYWGACVYLVTAHYQAQQQATYQWSITLVAAIGVIIGSYLFAYVYDGSIFFMCTTSTLSYSVIVCGLVWLLAGKKLVFADPIPIKYKNSTIEADQKTTLFNKIKESVEYQQLYLDPELTLQLLSQRTSIRLRDISQVVNEQTGTNFSDWINGYRIEVARQKLVSAEFENAKVVTIAFETGFNTLSSFNAVFKAKTGFTPTEYRNFHRLNNPN